MRLLELRATGASTPLLEFHPNLTVVRGLTPEARDAVLRAVSALPSGGDPGLGGLVEAEGILFDLDQETLQILGLASPVDALVRAGDLPRGLDDRGNGDGRGRVATGSVDEEPGDNGAEPALVEESPIGLGHSGAELAAARQAVQAARDRLAATEMATEDAREASDLMIEALERARLERAASMEAHQRIMAALEKARRERDAARARRDGRGEFDPADEGRERALRERVEQLRETEAELTEAITELEERDPRPIQVLLDALREPAEAKMVPSEDAIALADEFAELQQQLDELERRLQADGLSMDQLSRRLEDARDAVAGAEQELAKPDLTSDDISELDAAHEDVLEAEKKTSSRIGRKAALKRLEDAKLSEQAVLDRVGFPTWAAYVMGSSLLNIDPIAEQRLDQARQELEEAETAWADLTTQLEEDPDYAELLDRLEAVFLAAFDILGGEVEGDLEERLRSHLVPDEEISKQDLVDALVYQLSLRGVEVDDSAPVDVAAGAAERWLAEAEDHWERHRAFQEEQVQVAGDLAATERELQMVAGDPADRTPEARQRMYEEAEARVADILSDLEAATEIESELDGQVEARELLLEPIEQALTAAEDGLAAAVEEVEEAERVLEETRSATTRPAVPSSSDRRPEVYDHLPYAAEDDGDDGEAPSDEDSLEFYLLARLAALRNLSHAGSVPMLIDDALAEVPAEEALRLLSRLERMTGAVQVIYVTDDEAVADWVDAVGLERAAVVTAETDFAA